MIYVLTSKRGDGGTDVMLAHCSDNIEARQLAGLEPNDSHWVGFSDGEIEDLLEESSGILEKTM